MKELHGIGYVPGYAVGHISRHLNQVNTEPKEILLLEEPDVDSVLELSSNKPAGVIILGGARFSHLAIYLYSLNIPTVLLEDQKVITEPNQLALLDGYTGSLIFDPDKESQQALEERLKHSSQKQPPFSTKETGQARTKDDVPVIIGASISSASNAETARIYGADEIGLVRSEFLFSSEANPTNLNDHLTILRQVCEAAAPLPIKIRLFDVGGEKIFGWVPAIKDIDKTLGVRGSRIYKYDKFSSLFNCQLESIAMLAHEYEVSILVPFVSKPEEFVTLRKKIEAVTGNHRLRIGAMIETPSMCLSLREIAGSADFIALGTNDLMQCFFGADRGLKSTAQFFDPYSPALFRFLQIVADNSITYNTPVQVCGQLPLYPYVMPLLLGLGFRQFSVEPYIVPALKDAVRSVGIKYMRQIADHSLQLGETELKTFIAKSIS